MQHHETELLCRSLLHQPKVPQKDTIPVYIIFVVGDKSARDVSASIS